MRRVVFAVLVIVLMSPVVISATETGAGSTSITQSLPDLRATENSGEMSAEPAGAPPIRPRPRIGANSGPVEVPAALSTGQRQAVNRDLTRLRLRIDSTSTRAALSIGGVSVAEYRVLAASAGDEVRVFDKGLSIKGSPPLAVELLAIYRVPENAQPRIRLDKNPSGTATGRVYQANIGEQLVAELRNSYTDETDVGRGVSRSSLVGAGLSIPLLDSRRLTLAFYYPWFSARSFDNGLWWEKPTGPHDTTDAAEVRAIVNQAASYGVNGFIVSFARGEDNETRFQYVLDAARQRGNFFVTATLRLTAEAYGDGTPSVSSVVDSARYILRYSNEDSFLKINGRPVLFVFGSRRLTAAQWAGVRNSLATSGVNPFLIGDTTEDELSFDGAYLYDPNERAADGLKRKYHKMMESLRLPPLVDSSRTARLWAATVSPGFNNRYRNMSNPKMRSRDGGVRYDATWQAALSTSPEWVLVTSWNEWFEATHISPGARTGSKALQQTASWSSRFENS